MYVTLTAPLASVLTGFGLTVPHVAVLDGTNMTGSPLTAAPEPFVTDAFSVVVEVPSAGTDGAGVEVLITFELCAGFVVVMATADPVTLDFASVAVMVQKPVELVPV